MSKEALIARLKEEATYDLNHQTIALLIDAADALAQPAQQEPVQFKCTVIDDAHPSGIPLEQWAKPQRTWVGLTNEQIEAIWRRVQANDFHDCVQPFAQAIEAKLKEKNEH